jgi:hypothetical protein
MADAASISFRSSQRRRSSRWLFGCCRRNNSHVQRLRGSGDSRFEPGPNNSWNNWRDARGYRWWSCSWSCRATISTRTRSRCSIVSGARYCFSLGERNWSGLVRSRRKQHYCHQRPVWWLDHRAARSQFCGASRGLSAQQFPLLLLTSSLILFFVVRGSRNG